jgi:hypothetical protein
LDRRTENRLIGSLSTVVVAGLLVMIVGVVKMALTNRHSDAIATLADESSPTSPYRTLPPDKQAAVDSDARNRAAALVNPPPPGALKPEPVISVAPTTPQPTLSGVLCDSDNLFGNRTYSQGDGGWAEIFFTIANTGETDCDLPPIQRVQAFDAEGNSLFDDTLQPRSDCSENAVTCLRDSPVLLDAHPGLTSVENRLPGTAQILAAWYDRCDLGNCTYSDVHRLVFTFRNDVSVTVEDARMPFVADRHPRVWSILRVPAN